MILFPNAKINIGLNVIRKREDNFHDIETIFLPIGLSDILEFVPAKKGETNLYTTGIDIECEQEKNLVYKAWKLLKEDFPEIDYLDIYLHKNIPANAGLGGGSSDAAFMIKGLNKAYNLQLPDEKMEQYASRLGSDCAFFIKNKKALAVGKGDELTPISLFLENKYIVLVNPGVNVSTRIAYKDIKPQKPISALQLSVRYKIKDWKGLVKNDFEKSVFEKYPEISEFKDKLYEMGADYAAMSGSGASVFGIFSEDVKPETFFDKKHIIWQGKIE